MLLTDEKAKKIRRLYKQAQSPIKQQMGGAGYMQQPGGVGYMPPAPQMWQMSYGGQPGGMYAPAPYQPAAGGWSQWYPGFQAIQPIPLQAMQIPQTPNGRMGTQQIWVVPFDAYQYGQYGRPYARPHPYGPRRRYITRPPYDWMHDTPDDVAPREEIPSSIRTHELQESLQLMNQARQQIGSRSAQDFYTLTRGRGYAMFNNVPILYQDVADTQRSLSWLHIHAARLARAGDPSLHNAMRQLDADANIRGMQHGAGAYKAYLQKTQQMPLSPEDMATALLYRPDLPGGVYAARAQAQSDPYVSGATAVLNALKQKDHNAARQALTSLEAHLQETGGALSPVADALVRHLGVPSIEALRARVNTAMRGRGGAATPPGQQRVAMPELSEEVRATLQTAPRAQPIQIEMINRTPAEEAAEQYSEMAKRPMVS